MKVEIDIKNCSECPYLKYKTIETSEYATMKISNETFSIIGVETRYCTQKGFDETKMPGYEVGCCSIPKEIPDTCPLINKNNIDLIKDTFKFSLLTDEEAKEIHKTIKDITDEDLIKQFIKEDLRIFRYKKDVFYWFIEEDFMLSDLKKIEINKSDIPEEGIDLYDLVIDQYLISKCNYIKINDNLYITWMQ